MTDINNHLILQIKGMRCEDCVRAVSEAILGVEGVDDATVDLDTARAEIELNAAEPASVADVIASVRQAGYDAEEIDYAAAG